MLLNIHPAYFCLNENQAGEREDSVPTSGSPRFTKGSNPNMVGYLPEKQTSHMSTSDSKFINNYQVLWHLLSYRHYSKKILDSLKNALIK